MPHSQLILVTGATGYVGGRLVPRLLADGYRVRCLVRDLSRLQGRPWLHQAELVQGDMLKPDSLVAAMRDVQVVYYLIHSLGGGSDFSERDLVAARNCIDHLIQSLTTHDVREASAVPASDSNKHADRITANGN